MKVRWRVAVLALALLVAKSRADSIDDAEAKKRGVPVAQVQAENALAAEKRKEAALQGQIAEAKKRIAELTSQAAAARDKGPTSSSTTPGGRAAATGSGAATKSGGPATSALYDDFVTRYLAGDWEKLAGDMAAKEKEIAALPAANVADLAFVRQVVAECRPSWWDSVKSGKIKQFQQDVWKASVQVRYQPESGPRLGETTVTNGALTIGLSWPAGDMDSSAPMTLPETGLGLQGNFGFRKADDVGSAIWALLGEAALIAQAGPDKVSTFTVAERQQFDLFAGFRKNMTAAYYGTPAMRRLMLFQSCATLSAKNDALPDRVGKRPLAAALMLEVALHRERYAHMHIEQAIGLDKAGDSHVQEGVLCTPVLTMLLARKLTLPEDRQLRDLIKTLTASNPDWRNSKISLGNNLAYDLDVAKDLPLAAARVAAISSGKAPGK